MSDEPEVLAESLRAEAANAAAVHEEAQSKARSADMHAVVTNAIREVLTEGDEGTKRLLIQKIPILCADIMKMKGDLVWIKWLLMGLVSGIGLIIVGIVIAALTAK